MRSTKNLLRKIITLSMAASLAIPMNGCGGPGAGALGLQDYQRDLLGGLLGALATAILRNVNDGGDDTGAPVRVVPGPRGPRGEPGPTFFSVFVDKFYGAQIEEDGGLDVTPVPVNAPVVRRTGGAIGYRMLVPAIYGANHTSTSGQAQSNTSDPPITMRLFFRRQGPCEGGCLVFTLDARVLMNGDREPRCFGGSRSDCADGRRWIRAATLCGPEDETKQMFFNIDLPLGASGLRFPEVKAGEYLAFEINPIFDDGGDYRLLGVEFFSRDDAETVNATIYTAASQVPEACESTRPQPPIDCNDNGVPDLMDIADGTSQDCNSNDVPDECDIANGTSEDTNGNGIPDECEDCNMNGVPDDRDIEDGTSQDCNENNKPDECDIMDGTSDDENDNGIPDECEDCNDNGVPDDLDIENGTSQDCNENNKPDECDIADGTSDDENENGIPDECEDCNDNGVPDDLDIENGTSQDCNENNKPDECDIADGTSDDENDNSIPDECEDCNDNGVPDDLDIENGTSQDCNENNKPDECDIADGTSDDENDNGIPDECEDCNNNGHPDDLDIETGRSQDCNDNNKPDECDIADGTSQDVNDNGIPDECEDCNDNGVPDDEDIENGTSEDCNDNNKPDECDIADGTSDDENDNGIPDECEDCNENGHPDDLDIETGRSQDCNENDKPDECDIADGTSDDENDNGIPDECEDCNENGHPDDLDIETGRSQDCNENDIPDECDIRDGTSADCNDNGIPDECEVCANGYTRYRLHNHPDGSARPPLYGMRLDELFNVSSSHDIFTFDFDDPRSNMWLDLSGDTIHVFGMVYGGLDTGTGYGNPAWAGLWEVDFVYHIGVERAPGDDDTLVNVASPSNNGRIRARFGANQGWINLVDAPMGGFSFRFGDNDDESGYRGAPGLNGWGWLAKAGQPHVDAQDFMFTAVLSDDCLPDCNANGRPDLCDISSGSSEDANGNGIPDECDGDCNDNHKPDWWDIEFGGMPDCNENGFPDECDIADGSSQDCNDNLIPDECEICAPEGMARYQLRNHPSGGGAPPQYGLRLDELYNVTSGNDIFTFDFNHAQSAVWLDMSPTTLIIRGVAYGGRDTGNEYGDPNHRGVYEIEFTYNTGVRTMSGDDDIVVDAAAGVNRGRIRPTFGSNQAWIDLADFRGSNPYSLRMGNENNDQGRLGFTGVSGWGWLTKLGQGRNSTMDWLFTVVGADCESDCNNNGVIDSCDIASGMSEDDNGNGVPDECEPS